MRIDRHCEHSGTFVFADRNLPREAMGHWWKHGDGRELVRCYCGRLVRALKLANEFSFRVISDHLR